MPKAPAADPAGPRLRIRLVFDDGLKIGPGKAELLEQIDRTGSISAAGRAMGMKKREDKKKENK